MPRIFLFFLFGCAFALAGTLAADTANGQAAAAPVDGAKPPVLEAKVEPSKAEPVKPKEEADLPKKPEEKPEEKPAETTTRAPKPTEPPKPTTPTPPPQTTSPSSQTTTQSPQTTTPSPQTTTAAPVTTTVPPTVPPPSQGKWMVNQTGKVCVVMQMAAQFNISYNTTDNKKAYAVFDLPAGNATATASGVCGEKEQNLTLSWPSQMDKTWDNFTLHFVKNETTSRYSLHHLELQLPASALSNANLSGPVLLVHQEASFTTGLSNSYRCMKQQTLELKGSNNITGHIVVSDLQFQAFRSDNTTNFALAKDCAFDVPDVVPIAVGCALAGLVVVVLVAYLVSRRRSQARGYLSM